MHGSSHEVKGVVDELRHIPHGQQHAQQDGAHSGIGMGALTATEISRLAHP